MLNRDRSTAVDQSLQERARRVVPNGVYGHQSTLRLPKGFPQFFTRGAASRVWDVDGNEYIDFMCAYGPIVLGHRHPTVEAAVARQAAHGEVFNGPTEQWVELAELLVETIPHADWAWFAKNGGDATTYAVTVARAATGRAKLLRARGAYHGATPWWTPVPAGVTPEDTANQIPYAYNDLESVHSAANQAGNDLAAIIVSPFKHDARFDQEDVDPEFAHGLREVCDATGAALILDDVRAGFRLNLGGSWEPIGVRPDISCYSKAVANGYPLAAVGAAGWLREAAERVYATGSFWFAAVPQAAAIATVETLRDSGAIAQMRRVGELLRAGLDAQAAAHGLRISQSGPVQIPFLTFSADTSFERANVFCLAAVQRGVYFHPWHNWFLSAAHTEDDIRQTLEVSDVAFGIVRKQFGEG